MKYQLTPKRLVAVALVVLLVSSGVGSALAGFFGAGGGTSFGVDGGPEIGVEPNADIPSGNPVVDGSTVNVTTDSNGWIRGESTVNTSATAQQIEGTETKLNGVDVSNGELTVTTSDKAPVTLEGGFTEFDYRDPSAGMAVDDGTVDFRYSSTGTGTVTLQSGLVASETVAAVDANDDEILGTATTDASGGVSLTVDNPSHDVHLQTNGAGPSLDDASATPQGGATQRFENVSLSIDVSDTDLPEDNVTVEFYVDGSKVGEQATKSDGTVSVTATGVADGSHSWYAVATDAYGVSETSSTFSFNVDHYDPVITDPQPIGPLQQEPGELSVNISDRDFANDGDQLTATLSLDGTQLGSDTLNANGTANATISSPLAGGQHSATVEVTDSYGQTETESWTFKVPDTLFIRNESNTSQLINGSGTTVEVTFFGDDQVYRRSSSDGTVNLTGLPVGNQPFVIQAQTDGYVQRRAVIQNIYQQQTVYLLPENATRVQTRFELEDNTGQFDSSSTKLFINKPLSINGSLKYQTVAAGSFGPAGFTTELEEGQRYQLRVVNDDGDSRALGAYQATLNETVTLTVGELTFPVTAEDTFSVDGEAITDSSGTQTAVKFEFAPPNNGSVDSLEVTIHERYNESNSIYTETIAPVDNNLSRTVMLSGSEVNTTWVADYSLTLDGETVSGTLPLSGQRFGTGLPIEDGLLSIFATGFLLLVGGLFSRANAAVGALIIPLVAGALWMANLVPPAVSGASIALAFGVAALYRVATADGGGIP